VRGADFPRRAAPGAIVLAAGLIVLAAALLHPRATRSDFEFGFLFLFFRVGQALPLFGFGLALARVQITALIGLFGLGTALGRWSKALFLANVSGAGLIDALFLTPPFSCIAVGLLLVAPLTLRRRSVLPAAPLLGAALGLNISLSDPTTGGYGFVIGAAIAGCWLVAVPALAGRLVTSSWFVIAARIFGGWLIAIGLMLGALQLIPLPY